MSTTWDRSQLISYYIFKSVFDLPKLILNNYILYLAFCGRGWVAHGFSLLKKGEKLGQFASARKNLNIYGKITS
jgi:hypothetical protein